LKYLLFTIPNCSACGAMKSFLADTDLDVQEYDLARKEGRMKIREFLKELNRDEKGAIILPTMIIRDEESNISVLNSHEELGHWMQSRD